MLLCCRLWVMHAGLFAEVCPCGVGAVQSAIVDVAAESPAGALLEFALCKGTMCVVQEVWQVAQYLGHCCTLYAEPVLEHFYGSRILKKLVMRGGKDDLAGKEAQKVSAELWARAVKPNASELALGHAGKVGRPCAATARPCVRICEDMANQSCTVLCRSWQRCAGAPMMPPRQRSSRR